MAEIEMSIVRDGFPSIRLDTDGGGPFGLEAGSRGLGAPPLSQRWTSGAGEGARLEGERAGAVPIDLAVSFHGSTRVSTGQRIRELLNLTRRRKGRPDARLVATFPNGDIFERPIVYTSGLEIDYTDALPELYRTVVALTSASPYWVARKAEQFRVSIEGEPVGLLPDLAALQVMSSQVIGTKQVTNPGDVGAYPVIVVTGPGGPASMSIGGVGWEFDATLAEGETRTIDHAAKTIRDQDGASRFAEFVGIPKFPEFPAGESVVEFTLLDATPDASISAFWKPRREGIY